MIYFLNMLLSSHHQRYCRETPPDKGVWGHDFFSLSSKSLLIQFLRLKLKNKQHRFNSNTTFLIYLVRNRGKNSVLCNQFLFILIKILDCIMKVMFGLCCQSCLTPKITASTTTTITYLKTLKKSDQGPYLIQKAKVNISALEILLRNSMANGIQAFRISDSLIPMADLGLFDIEKQFSGSLEKVGKVANELNMHLSFHPSQFFLLTSKNPQVIKTSVSNFNIFAKILSLMKLKNKPTLLTHVGAIKCYSSYEEACDAFCQNFKLMSPQAQQYFAVENDQNSHSIDSCMYIHHKIGIPVVFDHAHYLYKPVKGISQRDALKMAMSTWGNRMPKVHLCSQAPGVAIHNHADYVDVNDYLTLQADLQALGVPSVIMMTEVKKKDEAILKLKQQIQAKRQQKAALTVPIK